MAWWSRKTAGALSGQTLLLIAIFTVAIFLRLALALLNRQANDDHLRVVELLLQKFRHLSRADCPECFHPKLFYVVCVAILKIMGVPGQTLRVQIAQFLNALAGTATLTLILAFLQASVLSARTRVIVFAMVALNPSFIGINGQATNDTFGILFGTAALYGFWRFLRRPSLRPFLKTIAAVALAIASKGTALVIGIALGLAFIAQTIAGIVFGRGCCAGLRLAIVLGIIALSIAVSDYDFSSYRDYGGLGRDAPLHLREPTLVLRPGVVSIADSYLTFRFVGLLKEPMITNDIGNFPWHRTSVWTQLYARLHFVQFDNYPPMWLTRDPHVRNVGRVIFVFALLPTFCFFWGLARRVRGTWRDWRRKGWLALVDMESLWPLIVVVGYVLFIVKFTLDYRDFAAMKALYLFPGMLAFVALLAEGVEVLGSSVGRSKLWSRLLQGGFAALALLYVWDLVLLLIHLVGFGRIGKT